MTAEEQKADRAALVERLIELRETGRRVPCIEATPAVQALWTSEDGEDQERAAQMCVRCAAATSCGQYGTTYPKEFGVYGGATDSERRPKRGRPTKTKENVA